MQLGWAERTRLALTSDMQHPPPPNCESASPSWPADVHIDHECTHAPEHS